MKIKLLLTGALAAAIVVSSAVAAPPAGKGKPKTGEGCKPRVAVILKGTLTGVGSPLTVKVTSANRWGKAYVGGSDDQVAVNSDTKVRGQGMKQLSQLKTGFRVLIQARACKADLLTNGAPPALTASKVVAHDPAKTEGDDEKEKKDKEDKDDKDD